MKYLNFAITIIAFAVFILSCKECPDPTQPITCPPNFENINETCVCPPDKFQAFGVCRSLEENQYYGITEGCYCLDTIFLKVIFGPLGDFDTQAFSGTRPYNNQYSHDGWKNFGLEHYTLSDGDSIVTNYGVWSPCSKSINSQIYTANPKFYGKFIGQDTIRGKVIYQTDGGWNIDSCNVTFYR